MHTRLNRHRPVAGEYSLRLYVTGATPRSTRAIANLKAVCERHLAGRYVLEVVDIYQRPEVAVRQQIIAAPTMVKESPGPRRRVIGDLSNAESLLDALDLAPS